MSDTISGSKELEYPQIPRCDRRPRRPCRHSSAQERKTVENHHRRSRGAQRGLARIQIPGPRPVPTMEWLSPSEPRRDKDALRKTAGPAADGAGLRSTGRRAPAPHRRPERLHRARHTRHASRRMSPSGERGASVITRFV